jgi:7-cyano-7-deazaguanine synthase
MCVVLLSGGLDSATVAAIALRRDFEVHALTVDYGQRHRAELSAAKRVAGSLGIRRHTVIRVELAKIGGSALTGRMKVPKDVPLRRIGRRIPSTYVPARNTIFLSLAAALAESIGARDIFIGANAVDYSGYPDCRPAFLKAFERTVNLGTKAGCEKKTFCVRAPLVRMTKAQIIRTGAALGVDYSLTHSCYDPGTGGRPCGRCESCILRAKGFREAGIRDAALNKQEVV